ncbi:hypothetical protein DPMN_058704 [Dreissena polymorpha]|uniref:Uncharacterized protein n=1 Tax=Dreissena polymorpha TaxID=45954 RepID=A0A9D4C285_DREPO|nr:hypothetical protein DPMN_058704 [Dreissena polymorpha]
MPRKNLSNGLLQSLFKKLFLLLKHLLFHDGLSRRAQAPSSFKFWNHETAIPFSRRPMRMMMDIYIQRNYGHGKDGHETWVVLSLDGSHIGFYFQFLSVLYFSGRFLDITK